MIDKIKYLTDKNFVVEVIDFYNEPVYRTGEYGEQILMHLIPSCSAKCVYFNGKTVNHISFFADTIEELESKIVEFKTYHKS